MRPAPPSGGGVWCDTPAANWNHHWTDGTTVYKINRVVPAVELSLTRDTNQRVCDITTSHVPVISTWLSQSGFKNITSCYSHLISTRLSHSVSNRICKPFKSPEAPWAGRGRVFNFAFQSVRVRKKDPPEQILSSTKLKQLPLKQVVRCTQCREHRSPFPFWKRLPQSDCWEQAQHTR